MIPYNKYKKYKKIQQHQYYFDIKSKILHWVHKKKKKEKRDPYTASFTWATMVSMITLIRV